MEYDLSDAYIVHRNGSAVLALFFERFVCDTVTFFSPEITWLWVLHFPRWSFWLFSRFSHTFMVHLRCEVCDATLEQLCPSSWCGCACMQHLKVVFV